MKDLTKKPLKIGMPLPWDLVLSRGQIRFRKGTPVTNEILKLIKEGKILELTLDNPIRKPSDDDRAKVVKSSSHSEKHLRKSYIVKNVKQAVLDDRVEIDDPFRDYFENLKNIWLDSASPFDINNALRSVDRWISTLESRDNLFASIGWLHDRNNFLPMHMMNLSRFLSGIAFELDMQKTKVRDLALAAMLHDIGEIYIGRNVLSKTSQLTESEWKKLKEHPRKSVEYLKRAGYSSETIERLILRHHERYDGSGYPYNITGKVLGVDDCLMGISDMYIAMISPRPYRNAYTRREALRTILSLSNIKFPSEHVKLFARIMGLYPPGSIVQLKSGGIAVVLNAPVEGRWPGLLISSSTDDKPHEKIDLNHLAGDYIVQEIA